MFILQILASLIKAHFRRPHKAYLILPRMDSRDIQNGLLPRFSAIGLPKMLVRPARLEPLRVGRVIDSYNLFLSDPQLGYHIILCRRPNRYIFLNHPACQHFSCPGVTVCVMGGADCWNAQ